MDCPLKEITKPNVYFDVPHCKGTENFSSHFPTHSCPVYRWTKAETPKTPFHLLTVEFNLPVLYLL